MKDCVRDGVIVESQQEETGIESDPRGMQRKFPKELYKGFLN
jgi:hypothetical protein